MESDLRKSAQEFARAKLTEWLGAEWNPPFSITPSRGFHGTRKHWAESILEEGFVVPESKSDGRTRKRTMGPAVYFFVETPRSLSSGLSGIKAASIYAAQRRSWPDAAVIVTDFRINRAVDMDMWRTWGTLFAKVMESISRDVPTEEERRAGYENAVTTALTIIEDALEVKLEAVTYWAAGLPLSKYEGYQTLAIRPPAEPCLSDLQIEVPVL